MQINLFMKQKQTSRHRKKQNLWLPKGKERRDKLGV